MKIHKTNQQAYPLRGIPARRGEIASDREDREVLWQPDGEGGFYITCPGCSAISHVADPHIRPTLLVHECVICVNCRTHFFAKLEDWDGPVYIQCHRCGIYGRAYGKDAPAGWKRQNQDTSCPCFQCQSLVCPKCL